MSDMKIAFKQISLDTAKFVESSGTDGQIDFEDLGLDTAVFENGTSAATGFNAAKLADFPSEVNNQNPGSGQIIACDGSVLSLPLQLPGAGYVVGDAISASPGTSLPPESEIPVADRFLAEVATIGGIGDILTINIINPGKGYTNIPTLEIATAAGAGAAFNLVIMDKSRKLNFVTPRLLSAGIYDDILGVGTIDTDISFGGAQKCVNLIDGASASQDSCTVSQMETYAKEADEGIQWKDACVAATKANIANLAAVGGTGAFSLDNIVIANGSRVLLKDQTSKEENGIYDYNDSGAGSLSRSVDADTAAKLRGFSVLIQQGDYYQDVLFQNATDNMLTSFVLNNAANGQLDIKQRSGIGQLEAVNGLENPTAVSIKISDDGVTEGMLEHYHYERSALSLASGGSNYKVELEIPWNHTAGSGRTYEGADLTASTTGAPKAGNGDSLVVAHKHALFLNGVLLQQATNDAQVGTDGDYFFQELTGAQGVGGLRYDDLTEHLGAPADSNANGDAVGDVDNMTMLILDKDLAQKGDVVEVKYLADL